MNKQEITEQSIRDSINQMVGVIQTAERVYEYKEDLYRINGSLCFQKIKKTNLLIAMDLLEDFPDGKFKEYSIGCIQMVLQHNEL